MKQDRKPGGHDPVAQVIMLGIVGMVAALAAPAIAAAADAPRRPNIVIILGDDMGFADMGVVRQRDQDAEPRLAGEGRRALHELLHARELLAHAVHAAERRRYPPERPGQHGRVDRAQPAGRGRLRRLPQRPGGHAAAAAQGRRLSHLHGRQVAHGQGARPDPGRARVRARLLAARRGGQLLGHDELHRRVAAVGLHRGRALPDEASRGLLRDEDLHRQADRVHRRQPRRRQALLRLRLPPGAARSRSTCRRSGATATSASTTRAGTRCGRRG